MDYQIKQIPVPMTGTSNVIIGNLSSSVSANNSSRQLNHYSNNFWENYEHLCTLQNLIPLQSIKTCLSADAGTNLVVNADKFKSQDWDPLISTLRSTKNLKNISFHSSYVSLNENSHNEATKLKGYAKLKKTPSIRNKERTNKLCRSLKDCLSISHFLTKLEIYNIPLILKDSTQIAKGLRSNKSLKILSLDSCLIGDDGLAEIQNSSNLNRINFSSCNLTHEGATILATLIKVQALKRHNEAWKDSLRYGRPDLDSMFGIRRITINSNQMIGDQGVLALADAFKSDLWLKALDLQNCGITTVGANHLLDGLKFNAMMHVLDVRLNVDIDRDTLQKIMEQVMINSSGNNTEYEWMDLTQTSSLNLKKFSTTPNRNLGKQTSSCNLAATKKNKKRRNTNASFTKKSHFNISNNSFKMKRCKSTGSVICNKSPSQPNKTYNSNGIPWRTAARADRFRASTNSAFRNANGLSSNNDYDEEYVENNYEDEYEEEFLDDQEEDDENLNENQAEYIRGDICKNKNNIQLNHSYDNHITNSNKNSNQNYIMASSTFDFEKFSSNNKVCTQKQQLQQITKSRKPASVENLNNKELGLSLDRIKNVSVKDVLSVLQKEQQSKVKLEDIILQLQDENIKLKSQLSVYKSRIEQQQQLINSFNCRQNSSNLNRTLLDDDKALEIIELTLYKYQNFLDFLRNAGFGKLIDIGEMNQQQSSNKLNKQKLQQNENEILKQQNKIFKQDSLSSNKSPHKSKSKSPLTDQQKYYLNKINKTKNKIFRNFYNDDEASDYNDSSLKYIPDTTSNFENSIINYDLENHNIDTLLSNALEISRSFRRFNSSSINNSTICNNNNKYINNEILLNKIEERKENSSGIDEVTISDLNDFHKNTKNLLISKNDQKDTSNFNKKSKKHAITTTSFSASKEYSSDSQKKLNISSIGNGISIDINSDENLKNHPSNASNSPATTIIPNSKNKSLRNQSESSSSKNSVNESRDKEIEVEDVSEILSGDDSHYIEKKANHTVKTTIKESSDAGSLKSSSDKFRNVIGLEDDDF